MWYLTLVFGGSTAKRCATRIGLQMKTENFLIVKHDKRWRKVQYALCAPLAMFYIGRSQCLI